MRIYIYMHIYIYMCVLCAVVEVSTRTHALPCDGVLVGADWTYVGLNIGIHELLTRDWSMHGRYQKRDTNREKVVNVVTTRTHVQARKRSIGFYSAPKCWASHKILERLFKLLIYMIMFVIIENVIYIQRQFIVILGSWRLRYWVYLDAKWSAGNLTKHWQTSDF